MRSGLFTARFSLRLASLRCRAGIMLRYTATARKERGAREKTHFHLIIIKHFAKLFHTFLARSSAVQSAILLSHTLEFCSASKKKSESVLKKADDDDDSHSYSLHSASQAK